MLPFNYRENFNYQNFARQSNFFNYYLSQNSFTKIKNFNYSLNYYYFNVHLDLHFKIISLSHFPPPINNLKGAHNLCALII